MQIELSQPVVVSVAPAGEARWGFWQFPCLARLPDGRLLLTHHTAPDSEQSYGMAGLAFSSADEGRTWTPLQTDISEFTVCPTFIAHLPGGECFFVPPGRPYPLSVLRGATPVGELISYGPVSLYDADAADRVTREMALVRWISETRRWTRETACLELPGALLWSRGGVVATTFLESKPCLDREGVLITPDYRNPVRLPDGSIPTRRTTILLESRDRGRTWRLRSHVAYGADTMYAEPSIAYVPSGELLCALRTTEGKTIAPLYLARSSDDGRTWDAPVQINDFGVFPQLLTLGNAVSVASFGRPGVWLMFSSDGRGTVWTKRTELVASHAGTCGYSSMVPLGDDRLLIAYSDFQYPVNPGDRRKAILVREVTVAA